MVRKLEHEGKAETKVFISYHRNGPSKKLAEKLHDVLEEGGYSPFVDLKDIPPGADWAKTIITELQQSDYFVLFLSEKANFSEMVLKEVEIARKLQDQYGKPLILPVRVEYDLHRPFHSKLQDWLYRIQQLSWQKEEDTEEIIEQLLEVISERNSFEQDDKEKVSPDDLATFFQPKEQPPMPVAPLEVPRGAVRLDSKFYVEREHESAFIKHVNTPGSLLRIRGPRQYGKTSLLARVMAHAEDNDHLVIPMDFQNFEESTLRDLDSLLFSFTMVIAEEVDREDELEEIWQSKGNRDLKQTTRNFIKREVLKRVDKPILIAMDEVDRVFNHPAVSSDFFLLLRGWHEASKAQSVWEKFKMAISYSTEAKLAIRDLNASPFNVGEEARIPPFSVDQIEDLSTIHGLSLTPTQLDELFTLLGGQPYLTRRAFYLITRGELNFKELIDRAATNDGPFSDHLRHHLVNVMQYEDASLALKEIEAKEKCKDPLLAGRLEATGLVKGTPPR